MPFDMNAGLTIDIPDRVKIEARKENIICPHTGNVIHSDKKSMVDARKDYGDPRREKAIVGKGQALVQKEKYFLSAIETITETMPSSDLQNVDVKWSFANNDAWTQLELILNDVKAKVTTPKHETEVGFRIGVINAIDATSSNKVFFGLMDFFCSNKAMGGIWDMFVMKNSSGFTVEKFVTALQESKQDFYSTTKQLQKYADTSLVHVNVKDMLDSIIKSERQSKKMYNLYSEESAVRGANVFALYSAFTNYASYGDERNNFKIKETGKDTKALTLLKREGEVVNWISSSSFRELVAA